MGKRGRPPLPPEQRKPRLSGAARRRAQHELEEAAEAAAAPAPVVQPEPEQGAGGVAWVEEFKRAGAPDLENPDTDLAYVRKLQLLVLQQMATTASPSKAQQDCWRRIREMSAVVGMTSNRAKLESRARDLEKKLAEFRETRGALKKVPGSTVARSPGARGQSRGPRPVPPAAPGELPEPPEPPEETNPEE